MSVKKLTFSLTGTTEGTEQAVYSIGVAAKLGIRGQIRKIGVKRTAGSGTQWKARFFLGDTADPDQICIASVLIPATASDFDHGQEATVVPRNPVPWSIMEGDWAAVWTSGVAHAGAGLYVSLEQTAGSGDDTVEVYVDTTRDRG